MSGSGRRTRHLQEHLALNMPGTELQADGVPGQLEKLDPVLRVHYGSPLGLLDVIGGLITGENNGRGGHHDHSAPCHLPYGLHYLGIHLLGCT